MAAYNKFNDFVLQLCKAKHDFSSHTFKAVLTNSAPAAANTILSDITQIANGSGYTTGGQSIGASVSLSTATATVAVTDVTWTASGGSVGPFRYPVVYNDTATSPADALVAYFDYGSSITLADGESFTLDFGSNQLFSLT
jgi:hypothetical protein